MKRIYTAVFRPWHTPYAWFGRDSGLATEGLRRIGIDSRLVILDTPGMDRDEKFLPATHEQFITPKFWRSLSLDAVVLQGGGDIGIDPVSRAIKESGTKLFLRLDTDGVVAPQVDPYLYCYNLWWWLAYHRRCPSFLLALGKTGLKSFLPDSLGPGRIVRRLKLGDRLLVESRIAGARLQRLLRQFDAPEAAARVVVLPIPVTDEWRYSPDIHKENVIISVARWYDVQKDAPKLIKSLSSILRFHEEFRAVLIGDGDNFISRLVTKHCPDLRHRISAVGRLPHVDSSPLLQVAKVFLCTSRSEGFPNSVSEAVCCGCSVVGPAEIASMHEYTSAKSGSLAWTRRTADFCDATSAEIAAWGSGQRDPVAISGHYRNMLSSENIAGTLVKLLSTA